MDGHTFIIIPSAIIRRIAEASLKKIETKQEKRSKESFDRERLSIERSWLRRFFRRPMPSDEKIMNDLRAESRSDSPFHWVSRSDEMRGVLARRLIIASKHTDNIHISIRDLELIVT